MIAFVFHVLSETDSKTRTVTLILNQPNKYGQTSVQTVKLLQLQEDDRRNKIAVLSQGESTMMQYLTAKHSYYG